MTKYTKEELPLQTAILIATSDISMEDVDDVLNRTRHVLAVAQKMRDMAEGDVDPDEAYRLGIVHDMGYGLTNIRTEHATCGGEWLRIAGYLHWKEVFYHGKPQTKYDSPLLRLLNYADMTTSPKGEDVTMQERIEDIVRRYGEDSPQAKDAKELAKMIEKQEG